MLEFRARNNVSLDYIEQNMKGKLLTDHERVITLNPEGGAVRLLQPDSRPLCVYLPGALKNEFANAWPTLQKIRGTTNNRGYASASERVLGEQLGRNARGMRTYSKEVISNILGSFDPVGSSAYCRLTAYNARQLEDFNLLVPLFAAMSDLFADHVPDRFKAQAEFCQRTQPDWVIPGTVYTTITVNSTYPTGVHTDKGDLDEGFSCLAVGRRGDYSGGVLTFPAYGVGVDMQDGDLILMDAHQYHGNTQMYCEACWAPLDRPTHRCEEMGQTISPERISVVAYYREKMFTCDTLAAEDEKRAQIDEKKLEKAVRE